MNIGHITGLNTFFAVGRSAELNAVTLASQRGLTMVYPAPQLFCGTTETTAVLTLTPNFLISIGIQLPTGTGAVSYTLYPVLTDATTEAPVTVMNLALSPCY